MTERDQLYCEIDTEVYTILASFQLHHPRLQLLDNLALHQLCCLMYSEGIRAGIQKCQVIFEERTNES